MSNWQQASARCFAGSTVASSDCDTTSRSGLLPGSSLRFTQGSRFRIVSRHRLGGHKLRTVSKPEALRAAIHRGTRLWASISCFDLINDGGSDLYTSKASAGEVPSGNSSGTCARKAAARSNGSSASSNPRGTSNKASRPAGVEWSRCKRFRRSPSSPAAARAAAFTNPMMLLER